jgi:exodeoxyribonuclease-3
MKVASFNVNSVRARLEVLIPWLERTGPDVLAVQETKVQDVDFPKEAFDESGYKYVFKGQPKYNGVAIFSKSDIEEFQAGFENEPKDKARLISAKIKGMVIVNTYVPQGYERDSEKFEYKLKWFERLAAYFDKSFEPAEPVLWVGDLNVAPEAKDVYDPEGLLGHVCFCPEVTEALNKVRQWGFVDLFRMHCDEPGQYTFWDYRMRGGLRRNLGWRMDHIMATKPLAEKCTACYIDKMPRLAEKPSDHTPIIAEFDWK